MSRIRQLMKTWYSPEVLPIYVITGVAVGGATWYLSRLARGPDVIWDKKNNPTPWNNVEPGTNTKMMSVNQEFERKYKRDRRECLAAPAAATATRTGELTPIPLRPPAPPHLTV